MINLRTILGSYGMAGITHAQKALIDAITLRRAEFFWKA